jgi:hypothetical protein
MSLSNRLFTAAALLATTAAFGQSAATVSDVPVSVRIFKPLTLSLVNGGLSFGDVFSDATGGTVTLDPQSDTRTAAGPALGSLSNAAAAKFQVTGRRGATYAIALPVDGTVTLTGNGAPMTVNGFKASVAGAAPANPATGHLPSTDNATETFKVGAVLSVNANQVDGDYTGTFAVTVAYN